MWRSVRGYSPRIDGRGVVPASTGGSDLLFVWNPNPTLDVASQIGRLRAGAVHTADVQTLSPGGKGTLLVGALEVLECECRGIAPIAGPSGQLFAELVKARALPFELTAVNGMTRVAASVVESSSSQATVINGPGPRTDDAAWGAHVARVEDLLRAGDFKWFVVAGRPPLSAPPELTARLCSLAGSVGARSVVDVASPVLDDVLSTRPWLVKINRDEAEAVLGRTPDTSEAAQALCRRGAHNAVVTDGPRMIGCAFAGARFALLPPSVDVRSAVGCGDCFLAGLLAALLDGDNPEAAIRRATAVASAAAETLEPGAFDAGRAQVLQKTTASATYHASR